KDSVEKDKAPHSPLLQDYVKEHTIEESPISLEDILSNVFSDVEAHEKEVYDEGVHVEDGKEDTNAGGKVDGKEVEKDDILVEDYLVDVGGGNDFFDVGAEKQLREMWCWRIIKISVAVICCTSELDKGLMSVVPKTFGCSIDCREVDEQMVVLSKTMISAKHVFNPMRSLRKQAADYCFLDDCDIPLSDNIVLWGTSSYLTKEDMEMMIPDKMIMVGVIEWWSLFLNNTCITVDLSRLFFGLAQMQPLVQICSPTNDEKTPKKKRLIELEECRQSQKGKKRKSIARKKTSCKKLKNSQSPSVSGAKSTITSTVEASASVSTPLSEPVSIKGDTPKSLKLVLDSRKRGMADDGLG
ncbi:hypothetical protein KSS87_003298, partial [Heliosperma pusillum]